MQLDLDIPDRMVRKLKALNALEGGHTPEGIESLVISMLEETVDNRIRSHLGVTPLQTGYSIPMRNTSPEALARADEIVSRRRYESLRMDTDESGMSDGLGDFDEDMPEGESDEQALVPKSGGVSDGDIDRDMDIDDPEHEAKAEAAEYPPDVPADAIISSIMGIPLPPSEDVGVDPRVAKRKRSLKIRGKVSGATDTNLNDLL